MGVRRKARELALKAMFEADLSQSRLPAILDRVQLDEQPDVAVMQFLQQVLSAYDDHREVVDQTIEQFSNNWKLGRMATVDRNILRLGASEILYLDDVPKSVAINEYLEIAKKYGSEESSGFVNGILDRINKPAVL